MKELGHFLAKSDDIQTILSGIENNLQEQLVAGLSGSGRSILTSVIRESIKRPILLVTHQMSQAEQLYEDLLELTDDKHVHMYPVNELIASEISIASPELRSARIEALTEWRNEESGILVAPIAALKRLLPPPSYWSEYQLPFYYGEDINVDVYLAALVDMGYEHTQMVSAPGEFSRRGGIIDIYPVTEENPVRIELFDEEVDSIRFFDVATQRSLRTIKEITIIPAQELLLRDTDLQAGADRLEAAYEQSLQKLTTPEARDQLTETIVRDIERLRQSEHFQEMYKYAGFLYEEPASLLDYLPKNGFVILDEMSRIQETALHLDNEEGEWYTSLLESNRMVGNGRFSFDWEHIRANMTQPRLYLSVFLRHIPNTQPENIVNLNSRTMQEFHGQMSLFKTEIERWQKAGTSVIILAPNQKRQEKMQEILRDYGIETAISDAIQLPVSKPTIIVGQLKNGIEFPLHKFVIVTNTDLFKTKVRRRKKQQKISNAERIQSYQELKVGDYVVHENHGIGKYTGIETLKLQNLHKDYMRIQYFGDDSLFVPIDQVDLVQKFVGSEGKEPRLYKLGGTEWSKVKRKVQATVEDIADDLIKLYAEREAQVGYAFSEDTELQSAFEGAFPYQETDDQLQCIEEIKQDMERERPMDRLLCGDVGYGKTEVAIRAAFKAVTDGKQVAILVPTTILAQQHFETMQERFQDFPINVGILSRFRTKKQQTEVIEGLNRGLIDVVVGTHRLLSKDIIYKDLGLLVVDEEQRFGVKHKERIKQLKTNVDVLTLTATPIPRTLHMSMLGVRDLSVIETPPENRFPIQTYVLEHNQVFVREAIEREMSRGGQVFYLYNRVDQIERIANEISMLIGDARVAVAHGQMNESELENVMIGFLEGEFDVLVSTTIIETGVDIPNVNTLIVHDADKMGLSQLYQLRGRVGRSNRVAYAYFTYQKDKVLTEVAEKRLQAIKEFTELGSGFKIAMRDLSIRGAGNLLGSQQHGFIDSVGFDMYSKMLREAIEHRKVGLESEVEKPFEPELTIKIDAYIPDDYIDDERQKIEIYKQFQAVLNDEDIQGLQEELIDRFGEYPIEVANLFSVTRLKQVAKLERISQVLEKPKQIEMLMEPEQSQSIDGADLFEKASAFGRGIQLGTQKNQLKIVYKWQPKEAETRYEVVEKFLKSLKDVQRLD